MEAHNINFQNRSKVFRHSSDIGAAAPQGGTNANRHVSILPDFPAGKEIIRQLISHRKQYLQADRFVRNAGILNPAISHTACQRT